MQPNLPQSILMATDLGAASESAFRFAGELSASLGARLALFHAVSPALFFDFGGWDPQALQGVTEKQMEQARAELRRLRCTELPQEIDVSLEVGDVSPAHGILASAERHAADLIVMGTHAWGPITSFFLGSVTQAVLHQSTIPVIAVRPQPGTPSRLRRILCPVNDTAAAQRAFEWAFTLSEALGADLRVLRLTERARLSEVPPAWMDIFTPEDIETLTASGSTADDVLRFADEQEVDLIVLGSEHHLFGDSTTIGRPAERIIHHASCPVMTVPVESTVREPAVDAMAATTGAA